MRDPRFLAVSGLLLVVAACGGSPTASESLAISLSGRLERGATVGVFVGEGAGRTAAGDAAITAEPAGAVELLSGGRLRLVRAGTVRLQVRQGTATGAVAVQIDVPPRVVFEFRQRGAGDLFSVALDGGELRRLTDHPAADTEPTSAAGRVVFVSSRDGSPRLFSIPVGGGLVERLTAAPTGARRPALSPDGTRLAFLRPAGEFPRLWFARGDGSSPAAAPQGVGSETAIDGAPSFAPHGQRVAFMSTRNGKADLWVGSPSAGPEPLVVHAAADVEPAWSPDGSHVAFVSTRDGNPELYLVDVATRQVRRLTRTPEAEGQPTWLMDGRLVFTVFHEGRSLLRWLDPTVPDEATTIPLPDGDALFPAAER